MAHGYKTKSESLTPVETLMCHTWGHVWKPVSDQHHQIYRDYSIEEFSRVYTYSWIIILIWHFGMLWPSCHFSDAYISKSFITFHAVLTDQVYVWVQVLFYLLYIFTYFHICIFSFLPGLSILSLVIFKKIIQPKWLVPLYLYHYSSWNPMNYFVIK